MPPIILYLPDDPNEKPRFFDGADGQSRAAKIGLKLEPRRAPSVTEGTKVVAPSGDDDYKDWSIEELLALASRHQYAEKPYPNPGVRRMRLLNFIRARARSEKRHGSQEEG